MEELELISEKEWEAQFENRQKEQEIVAIKIWFNNYYTHHEQKYRRLHTIGKLTDEGANPYEELITLYNEVEIKRARIQELERLLSESSK